MSIFFIACLMLQALYAQKANTHVRNSLSEMIFNDEVERNENLIKKSNILENQVKINLNAKINIQHQSNISRENAKLDFSLQKLLNQEYKEQEKETNLKKLNEIAAQDDIDTPAGGLFSAAPLILNGTENIENFTQTDLTQQNQVLNQESKQDGIISSMFKVVVNYLFGNGTGAFFQLRQYNSKGESINAPNQDNKD